MARGVTPVDDPHWEVVEQDGGLVVVDTLHDQRTPLIPGLVQARHPAWMRTVDGLRIAFASGREVFVIDALPPSLDIPRIVDSTSGPLVPTRLVVVPSEGPPRRLDPTSWIDEAAVPLEVLELGLPLGRHALVERAEWGWVLETDPVDPTWERIRSDLHLDGRVHRYRLFDGAGTLKKTVEVEGPVLRVTPYPGDPVLVWDAHHTLDSVVVAQPGLLVPDLDSIGLSKEDLRAIGLPGWHAPQGRHTPAMATEDAIVSETAIPERGLSVVWTLDQSLRVTSYRIRDSEGKWLGTVEIVDGAPKLLRPD